MVDLEVDRTALRRTRLTAGRPLPDEPAAGSVLVRIDSFALTANNVTYGAVGDLIGYWRFFPVTDDGWGRIPVWGHGEVVASACDGVVAGERLYGYWPMSSHVVLEPVDVRPDGFTDGIAHRADLPPVYNHYRRVSGAADADGEARSALFQPLFVTAFLIDAWLADEAVFGATTVVIASASSKTALGLAHLLQRANSVEVVGLTSARNVEFVTATGAYDRVVSYDDLPAGLGDGPAVLVDMAGDERIRTVVHDHFGDGLRRSVQVGMTHHDAPAAGNTAEGDRRPLAGPMPEFFFAPDHIRRRWSEWGPAGYAERLDAARASFDTGPGSSITIEYVRGAEAVRAAWVETVDGRADPSRGIVCSW